MLLGVFTSVLVSTTLFFVIYINIVQKGERLPRVLFSGLLLSINVRTIKSVIYFIFDIPRMGTAIGFTGLAFIGAFIWLYIKYSRSDASRFKRIELLHFLPGIIGCIILSVNEGTSTRFFYQMATWVSILYTVVAYYTLEKNRPIRKLLAWNRLVVFSILGVLSMFLMQLFSSSLFEYAVGAAIAGSLTYVLFFYMLRRNHLFVRPTNSPEISETIISKLKEIIEKDKIYLNNSITSKQLALEMGEPSYKVSYAIKKVYNKPFSELINHFRINEVKNRLLNNEHKMIKIEALAFEAGFGTPSAFYAAFKRETGTTPLRFIENQQKNRSIHPLHQSS